MFVPWKKRLLERDKMALFSLSRNLQSTNVTFDTSFRKMEAPGYQNPFGELMLRVKVTFLNVAWMVLKGLEFHEYGLLLNLTAVPPHQAPLSGTMLSAISESLIRAC